MFSDLVLVVDDEPSIIQLARMYLEREGYRVQAVGDGEAALEAVSRLRPALLVLDLLDLARLDAGTADLKMAPVDMKALLNSVAEKFLPQAKQGEVSLIVEVVDLPSLIGDGDRLAQVFTNLVDNALKYTPAGGQVTLRAALVGNGMEISIQDTGAGISPEVLPRIFDRFYQVDPSRSGGKKLGTGLGLAIVQEIVQAHSGRITVRSQPGQGSTFIIHLPLAQPDASTVISRRTK